MLISHWKCFEMLHLFDFSFSSPFISIVTSRIEHPCSLLRNAITNGPSEFLTSLSDHRFFSLSQFHNKSIEVNTNFATPEWPPHLSCTRFPRLPVAHCLGPFRKARNGMPEQEWDTARRNRRVCTVVFIFSFLHLNLFRSVDSPRRNVGVSHTPPSPFPSPVSRRL